MFGAFVAGPHVASAKADHSAVNLTLIFRRCAPCADQISPDGTVQAGHISRPRNPTPRQRNHRSDNVFKPISADSGQSGPRPHCGLCDEVHEHKNRDVIDLLEAGFKFRTQPLLIMATNSGTDRESICWEEHQYAVNVAAGVIEDDTEFTFVCALDEGDDWENDPSCWVKVNPLLGSTITEEYLTGRVAMAKKVPGKRNGIARLHFCEWTQSVNAAIKREAWMACKGEVDLAEMINKEYPCYGGLDLSRTRDFTALTLTWIIDQTKDAEKFASKTWFWTPADTLLERAGTDEAPYDLWAKDGFIEAVPGQRLRYSWLAKAIAAICAKYAPLEIGADQYGRLARHSVSASSLMAVEGRALSSQYLPFTIVSMWFGHWGCRNRLACRSKSVPTVVIIACVENALNRDLKADFIREQLFFVEEMRT